MKFNFTWLTEILPKIQTMSVEQCVADLTAIGLEVESVEQQNTDYFIEIAITPNRGDCLSLEGIARDLAAFYSKRSDVIIQNPTVEVTHTNCPEIQIESTAQTACPKYVGRILENIDNTQKTPAKILHRLQAAGIRPISAVVDITNYVLLEIGQPLHAFDLDTVGNCLTVRFAKNQETITLLDDSHKTLDSKTLVISDPKNPVALAGIMGGKDSGVCENTRHILLESAFFDPSTVRLNARKYGLNTDSSYRFERGVDFSLQERAIERASELLLESVGGKAGPMTIVKTPQMPKPALAITLKQEKLESLLGFAITPNQVKMILESLQMQVVEAEAHFQITPPSFRFDINIEADLIEEIARIYGYENIPMQLPQQQATPVPQPEIIVQKDQIKALLVARGFFEAITYSFGSREKMQAFMPEQKPLALKNPLSRDLGTLRSSLLPGLVDALKYNLNRQHARVRLFEFGVIFKEQADLKVVEIPMIGGVCCGLAHPKGWGQPNRKIDFYDLKGVVEHILFQSKILDQVRFSPSVHPSLHPHQTAELSLGSEKIGFIGALHPKLLQQYDLSEPLYLFELNTKYLKATQLNVFKPLSKFPSLKRDLALIVETSVLADTLKSAILNWVGSDLAELTIFDVYSGRGIDSGKKSIGIELVFQREDHTLLEEQVNSMIEGLLKKLNSSFGAQLRGVS